MAPLFQHPGATPPASPNRGRPSASFRFNLRELLLVTALVAVMFAWWRDHREQVNRQQVFQEQIHRLNKNRIHTSRVLIPLSMAPGMDGETYHEEYLPGGMPPAAEYFASTSTAEPRASGPDVAPAPQANVPELVEAICHGTDADFQRLLARRSTALDAPSFDMLLPWLNDSRPLVRQRTLVALNCTRQYPERAIPAMIPLLADPDLKTAQAAIEAIAGYAHFATEAMPDLVAIMEQDDSPLAVHAALAVHQVDYRRDIGPRLAQLLSSPHDFVRARVIRELDQHAERDDVEAALVAAYGRESNYALKLALLDALNDLDR
jgi:hypothetical protein